MLFAGESSRVRDLDAKPYYFSCPKCGSSERFIRVDEARTGMLSLLLLLTGHLIFALLARAPSDGRVQCGKCLRIFECPPLPQHPSNWKPLAVGALSIFIGALLLIPGCLDLRVLVQCYPELSGVLGAIQKIPTSVFLGLSFGVFSLAAVAAISIHFLNFAYRDELAQEYRMKLEDPIS